VQRDLALKDGRTLRVYYTSGADERLAVFWHHGTPNIGAPPEPLFDAADRLGIRFVAIDRPGYGGSTSRPGRDLASVAADVARAADELEIDRFAVLGHSGGGSHAMACGAALPDRVTAVACVAGLAPYGSAVASGLDWFAGMCQSGATSLRAALAGRAAKEALQASEVEYDPEFTAADLAALAGPWSWLPSVVGPAVAGGPGGLIDDDLAYVAPWGVDLDRLAAQVLIVHGDEDRVAPLAHGRWLAERVPRAELRVCTGDGHISVLRSAESALEWIARQPR
jgi:pimeloyl-ACP methyl ester carboxylesterase